MGAPAIPPSKTSLQGAYDKNPNILYDGNHPVIVRSSGVSYDGFQAALYGADVVGASPFAVGFSLVKPATGFTSGLPGFSWLQQCVNDTAVTFPTASSIDFGIAVDLVAAGLIPSLSTLALKQSDVPADESIYGISSFSSSGGGTNNVAHLSLNFKTFAPANITSTTGIATAGLQGGSLGGVNTFIAANSYAITNPGSGTLAQLTNTGGTAINGVLIQNSFGSMTAGIEILNQSGATLNFGIEAINSAGGTRNSAFLDITEGEAGNTVPLINLTNAGTGNDITAGNWDVTKAGQIDGKNLNFATTTSTLGQVKQNNSTLLHTFTGGSPNIFLGPGAGNFTSTGGYNVGIGENNFKDLTSGVTNVAIGHDSAILLTGGSSNTFVGVATGQTITASDNNTAVGYGAFLNGTGANNTSVGFSAGRALTTGTDCTFLGYEAGFTGSTGTLTNATAIGYNAQVTQSNSLILGDGNTDVGIGNTAPSARLDISKAGLVSILLRDTGAGGHTLVSQVDNANGVFGTLTDAPLSLITNNQTRLIVGNSSTSGKITTNSVRLEESQGSDTASANDLTLPSDGNAVKITAANQINAITATNWQAGSKVTLWFTGAPLVKHNTAGGAGTAPILLAGSADFQAAANSILGLILLSDGNWHETNRTVA